MKGYWRQFIPAAVVAVLMLGAAYGPRVWEAAWAPYNAAWWQAGWQAGWMAGHAAGGGKDMASWLVEGAGDATYNGTYTESGTYNGKPAYTNGTRWLYYAGGTEWHLGLYAGWIPGAYHSMTGIVGSYTPGSGTPPAPTVSEAPTGGPHTLISGYLKESDGTPVPGVVFRATKGATTVDSDPTDAQGYYEIAGLEDGVWTLSYLSGAAKPHRIFAPGYQPAATIIIPGDDPTLDWTIWWGAAGTVLDGDGNPVPGVTVDLYGPFGELYGTVQTAGNGAWAWTGAANGYYGARLSKPGYTFYPSSPSVNLMNHAPATGVDSTATLRDKTLAGSTVGQGVIACDLTQVHSLAGLAEIAGQLTCTLQVVSGASKRRGYYYRYLTRLWSE